MGLTFARVQDMGVCLMHWLAELQVRSGDGRIWSMSAGRRELGAAPNELGGKAEVTGTPSKRSAY